MIDLANAHFNLPPEFCFSVVPVNDELHQVRIQHTNKQDANNLPNTEHEMCAIPVVHCPLIHPASRSTGRSCKWEPRCYRVFLASVKVLTNVLQGVADL